MFKYIIDLFQTLNLNTEVTTELTGLLLNEVLCFVIKLYLTYVTNFPIYSENL